MTVGEARKTGWGDEARDLAEAVLDDEPDNFYAHGFLSVWHVEVVCLQLPCAILDCSRGSHTLMWRANGN